MSQHETADPAAKKKLYSLIKDVRVAMMTTVDADGSLRSRPMYNHTVEDDGDLWFFSSADGKTGEISRDGHVNLGYSDPSKQNYVSVSGRAIAVKDTAKAKQLWTEGLRVWFPKGAEDPDLVLIKVTPLKGEYWDSPSSTVLHVYGYVKALATGEPPYELGDDKKVRLG